MTMTFEKLMKPAQFAEQYLLTAILEGEYPPGSAIPAERDLAALIGVTRPTLRETLQRMAREGWLDIHHGKSTTVRDYINEGGMGVLSTMTRIADRLPVNFVENFLDVRSVILPPVSRMAVENQPARMEVCLVKSEGLPDTPDSYADYDWNLQLNMAMFSGNPFFRIILNDFDFMYRKWGQRYFRISQARLLSAKFYAELLGLVRKKDGIGVETRVRLVMNDVMALWKSRMGDIENES